MELIDEILSRENLTEALRKVESNGGSPGVDGVTVGELREHLKSRWPKIRKKILNGTYKPKMVKR